MEGRWKRLVAIVRLKGDSAAAVGWKGLMDNGAAEIGTCSSVKGGESWRHPDKSGWSRV